MEYNLNYEEIREMYNRINYLYYVFYQRHFYVIRNEIQEQIYKLFVNRNKIFHGDIIIYFKYKGNSAKFRFMANFPKTGKIYFIYHKLRLDRAIKIYFNYDENAQEIMNLLDNLYKNNGINDFVGNFIVTKYNNQEIKDYKIFNHMSKLELVLFYKDILRNLNYTNNFIRITTDFTRHNNINNKNSRITFRLSDLSLVERSFMIETNKYDQDENTFIKIRFNSGITVKLWPEIQDKSENNIYIKLKDEQSINK